MNTLFWSEFGILFATAVVGGAAILPFALKRLTKLAQEKPLKLSISTLTLLSFLQTAVLAGIAVGVGLLAAHATGLGAPYLEAILAGRGAGGLGHVMAVAGTAGVLTGLVPLIADLSFLPHWPQALIDVARQTTAWDNFFASFYGGINEEILTRLFGLSVLAWLLSFVWHTPAGAPTVAVFWSANIVMAVVFGIGHLPALKAMLGNLPPLMVVRTLLLNAPISLLCGWLFWTYGIEAAIFAHFAADIVYLCFGTMLLNRRSVSRHSTGA